MTPRAWRLEPLDDRGMMLGIYLFEATLEAYRAEWRDRKREKEREKEDGGTAENEFSKLKQRLQIT